jgi:hypothetical protein
VYGHKLHFSIHRKGRKEDNTLVAANFIEYFLCDLCAFAVNKNSVIDRSKYISPLMCQQGNEGCQIINLLFNGLHFLDDC